MENAFSLTYGLLAASVTMAGGLWVANQPKTWLTQEKLRGIMALGAGFLVALVLLELLPSAIERIGGEPHDVLGIVLLGAVSVFIFDRWVAPRLSFLDGTKEACGHDHDHSPDHGHSHGHSHGPAILGHGAACSALGCLAVCTFFDGVALSASFAAGSSIGILVLIGLLMHLLPEGVLAASVTLAAGASQKVARRAVFAVGAAFLLGAAMPMLLGGLTVYALPLAAGILLFVAFAQLIPESAASRNGTWLVLAGGLSFWIISQLLGHGH